MPRRTPNATPVNAECPIASEKNAIRNWTSGTPTAAAAGATKSTARSALFMNAGSAKASGNRRSIRRIDEGGRDSMATSYFSRAGGRAVGRPVAEQVGAASVHRAQGFGGEDLGCRPLADDRPVEADDAVGVARHDGEVVAHEQEAEPGLPVNLVEEIAEELFAGCVHTGNRLVKEKDVRVVA